MAQCTVCGGAFSWWKPFTKHSFKYTCGKCGGLVGAGCFSREHGAKGHDVIVCRKCQREGNSRTAVPTEGRLGGAIVEGRDAAQELMTDGQQKLREEMTRGLDHLSDLEKQLFRDADVFAENLIKKIEDALNRRAKEELRVALWLWLILGAAVATIGALSLLFAVLHKAVN